MVNNTLSLAVIITFIWGTLLLQGPHSLLFSLTLPNLATSESSQANLPPETFLCYLVVPELPTLQNLTATVNFRCFPPDLRLPLSPSCHWTVFTPESRWGPFALSSPGLPGEPRAEPPQGRVWVHIHLFELNWMEEINVLDSHIVFKEISICRCFFIHFIYALDKDAAVSFLTPQANNHAPTHSLRCVMAMPEDISADWPSVPAGNCRPLSSLNAYVSACPKRLSLETWFPRAHGGSSESLLPRRSFLTGWHTHRVSNWLFNSGINLKI